MTGSLNHHDAYIVIVYVRVWWMSVGVSRFTIGAEQPYYDENETTALS